MIDDALRKFQNGCKEGRDWAKPKEGFLSNTWSRTWGRFFFFFRSIMLRRRNERKSWSVPLFVVSKPTYLLLLHNGGTVRQTDIWGEVIGGLRWEEVKAEAPDRRKTKQRERERERETGFLPKLFRVQFFPFLYLHTSSERERKKERKTFLFRDERREIEKKLEWNQVSKTDLFAFLHTRASERRNKQKIFLLTRKFQIWMLFELQLELLVIDPSIPELFSFFSTFQRNFHFRT